jgi:hypothetical protein
LYFLNRNKLIDETETTIYKNYDRIIYLYMNLEHTMVIGGRGTSDNPVGNLAVVGVGEEKNKLFSSSRQL